MKWTLSYLAGAIGSRADASRTCSLIAILLLCGGALGWHSCTGKTGSGELTVNKFVVVRDQTWARTPAGGYFHFVATLRTSLLCRNPVHDSHGFLPSSADTALEYPTVQVTEVDQDGVNSYSGGCTSGTVWSLNCHPQPGLLEFSGPIFFSPVTLSDGGLKVSRSFDKCM